MRIFRSAYLNCPTRGLVVPVLIVGNPRTTIMQVLDLELILAIELRKLLLDVRNHERLNQGRCLWGYDAENTVRVSSTYDEIKTNRIENFPDTLAGMTVLAPGP